MTLVAATEKFQKGMKSASRVLDNFSGRTLGVSTAVTTAFGLLFRQFDKVGSELHDLSVATGISVEQLDFLKYAAEQSGAGLENITKAARELQASGIDPNRFEAIASSIAAIVDPTERAQSAFFYFGQKAGAALLPMLNDLPALRQQFEKLGGGFTGKLADAADKLGDTFGDVKLAIRNTAFAIADILAPTVIGASQWVIDHVGALRDWVHEHSELVKLIGGTVFVLGAVIPVLWSINKVVKTVTESITLLGFAASVLSKNPVLLALSLAALGGFAAYKFLKPAVEPTPVPEPAVTPTTAPANIPMMPKRNDSFGAMLQGMGQRSTFAQAERSATAENTASIAAKTDETNQLLRMLLQQQAPQLAYSTNAGTPLAMAGVR